MRTIGTNFGPWDGLVSPAVSATYSNMVDGLVYNATNCAVVAGANKQIVCDAAPGVGRAHLWTVTVDSRALRFEGGRRCTRAWARTSTMATSYNAPTIASIDGAHAIPTAGKMPI